MPDAQTFKVLDAVQQLPQPCTCSQVQRATGLSERMTARRLTQLQLEGYIVMKRGIGWALTDLVTARSPALEPREYAFRSVLVPGVAWPYGNRATT